MPPYRVRLPIAACVLAITFIVAATTPAFASAGGTARYAPMGAVQPATVSPSGCYQHVDNPHKSLHLGWIAGELRTECRNPVPEISQVAQLWEKRWWGWDRVGEKGTKVAYWKQYLPSWANVTCRNSTLKTTGTGYVIDVDGDHYYASTTSASVKNPCKL